MDKVYLVTWAAGSWGRPLDLYADVVRIPFDYSPASFLLLNGRKTLDPRAIWTSHALYQVEVAFTQSWKEVPCQSST